MSRPRYCPPCRRQKDLRTGLAAEHARRARKRQVPTEMVDAAVVFVACRWTCGICGLPVEPDTYKPDMASASLDHVLPLSRGGSHTYDNVQLAHLGCNIRKGARI